MVVNRTFPIKMNYNITYYQFGNPSARTYVYYFRKS